MVSHRRTFHQNIQEVDQTFLEKTVKRLERNNRADNSVRFDVERYMDGLLSLPPSRAERIVEKAFAPCDKVKTNAKLTAVTEYKKERAAKKKAMRSRRR